jgi:lipopolysaccharide/colanic/teichoic acid biosynthesis glycosyltransferase
MTHRKRIFDVIVGTLLALAALPLVLVLAVSASAALRSWPFFVQDRVGRGGRAFKIIKIRTLPRSAPAYADKYEIASVQRPAFCEWLRRTHLDELPQLFLVPIGHMSLVGPRPEMAVLLEKSDPEFVRVRNMVRPGCTGLWQVGGRTDALINDAPDYDLYYLGEASLRLDCWTLWRTFAVMFLRSGSVEPIDVPAWLRGWGLIPSREFIAVMEVRFKERTLQPAVALTQASAHVASPPELNPALRTVGGVPGRQSSGVAS